MYIPQNTIIFLLVAFTITLLSMGFAFVYIINLYRNRKNDMVDAANMAFQQGLLAEYERFINCLAAKLHNEVLQPIISVRHRVLHNNLSDPVSVTGLHSLLNEIETDINAISQDVNLEYLRSTSLLKLIENDLQKNQSIEQLHFQLQSNGDFHLEDTVKIILYRIAQEAITNCRNHALASLIKVEVMHQKGNTSIRITDNGIGLNPDRIYGTGAQGIANMRNRAALINANLQIISEVGGTTVSVDLKKR